MLGMQQNGFLRYCANDLFGKGSCSGSQMTRVIGQRVVGGRGRGQRHEMRVRAPAIFRPRTRRCAAATRQAPEQRVRILASQKRRVTWYSPTQSWQIRIVYEMLRDAFLERVT